MAKRVVYTMSTPVYQYRSTSSPRRIEVDDQAPIPLIVGIALALFIGFVIIVCCICRRRSLSSSSSSNSQDTTAGYQRAPTADGTQTQGAGAGLNSGAGGNSFPMAPVNSAGLYPSAMGPQGGAGMSGQSTAAGGMGMGPNYTYPSLPPNAYTPPYPLGYTPLPSYMPTSQSSHASSGSGPSSEHVPSGFSSSSPPPAPAPAPSSNEQSSSQQQQSRAEQGSEGVDAAGVTASGLGMLGQQQQQQQQVFGNQGQGQGGFVGQGQGGFVGQGQGGYGGQGGFMGQGRYGGQAQGPGGYGGQGQVGYGGQGQGGYGGQGQGMGHPGYQMAMMNQRGMVMMGQGGGVEGGASYSPTMHPTAMDYVPGGGFIPRVGSPMPPPGTTVTELDQL